MAIVIADDIIGITFDEPALVGCCVLLQPIEETYYHCEICGMGWYE